MAVADACFRHTMVRFKIASQYGVKPSCRRRVYPMPCMFTAASANVGTSGRHSVYEDRETFYPALAAFTEDEDNVRFLSDIVYNDDGEIEASDPCQRLAYVACVRFGVLICICFLLILAGFFLKVKQDRTP